MKKEVSLYVEHNGSKALAILTDYIGESDTDSGQPSHLKAYKVAKSYENSSQNMQMTAKILDEKCVDLYEKCEEKFNVWLNEGISLASLNKYNVRYDALQNRLVFPIRNLEGNIINISGRALDKDWKEKGQRKYTYYYKLGALNTLFGLYENKKCILEAKEIVLFEGAKSVMKADSWGVSNVAAILTSHLNKYQMQFLAKLGCRVVFALDKDVNICNDVNIKKLSHYVPIEYIFDRLDLLDEKMSPVDAGFTTWQRLYGGRLKFR